MKEKGATRLPSSCRYRAHAARFLLVALVMTSWLAVGWRAAGPAQFPDGFDRVAMRHTGGGDSQRKVVKRRTVEEDDLNRDLDKLEARMNRLWIKVENLETKLLKNIDTTPDKEATNA